MKIERMDYVNTKDFNLDELEVFESLIVDSGYKVDEEIDIYSVQEWCHYGVTLRGYTAFYSRYFKTDGGRNVSEQLRKYLDSLESTEESPVEETPKENLSVKERLLALADGKELEYLEDYGDWERLDFESSFFGDTLYNSDLKVRVKVVPEKSEVELLFEEYCLNNGYDPDVENVSLKVFKAGYDAAKQEND